MLDPGRGRTKAGYFWAIARDDGGWGGQIRRPWSTPTRQVGAPSMPITLLKDFSGVLQTDGYGAYKTLASRRKR